MATTNMVIVESLSLDLNNFRTVTQPNEFEAVRALISINPDWFWALMDSLLEDGYLPTDNIIAIKDATDTLTIVKEGNRRIASMKLIHGLIDRTQLGLPASIIDKINNLSTNWIIANQHVPCTTYDHSEMDIVNKIVTRAHGKGEKAGRNPWPSVAKARYNRDIDGASENGLTLLEKYLSVGRNVSEQQKERWAGDYPISILDAALPRVASRLGATTTSIIVSAYPNLTNRDALENMLSSIGQRGLSFDDIRSVNVDFAAQYGIPPLATSATSNQTTNSNNQAINAQAGQEPNLSTDTTSANNHNGTSIAASATTTSNNSAGTPIVASTTQRSTTVAAASNTPKSVLSKIRLFRPRGSNREKIVDLKNEILQLNITKSPIAFCFLLRSLFEISAKVYCTEQNIATTTGSGNRMFDRKLIDLLTDATNILTQNRANQPMVRQLTGALQQLSNQHGILSVTSMNQLVHNPSFSVLPADVCVLFHNIYPLLENMN